MVLLRSLRIGGVVMIATCEAVQEEVYYFTQAPEPRPWGAALA